MDKLSELVDFLLTKQGQKIAVKVPLGESIWEEANKKSSTLSLGNKLDMPSNYWNKFTAEFPPSYQNKKSQLVLIVKEDIEDDSSNIWLLVMPEVVVDSHPMDYSDPEDMSASDMMESIVAAYPLADTGYDYNEIGSGMGIYSAGFYGLDPIIASDLANEYMMNDYNDFGFIKLFKLTSSGWKQQISAKAVTKFSKLMYEYSVNPEEYSPGLISWRMKVQFESFIVGVNYEYLIHMLKKMTPEDWQIQPGKFPNWEHKINMTYAVGASTGWYYQADKNSAFWKRAIPKPGSLTPKGALSNAAGKLVSQGWHVYDIPHVDIYEDSDALIEAFDNFIEELMVKGKA